MNYRHNLPSLSRRGFLKLGALSLAAAALPEGLVKAAGSPISGMKLGRVSYESMALYAEPNFSSRILDYYWQDTIMPISEEVAGEENEVYGPEWFRIASRGYAHASMVQPVEINFQPTDQEIVFTGSLTQVTVPFVDVYDQPSSEGIRLYRYYYQSNHWVDKAVTGRDGKVWYRIMDDKFPERERWARADHFRVFDYSELAPIAPDVPAEEKKIVVMLESQVMLAYEGIQQVFETKISTGDTRANPRYQTPTGRYLVGFKRASQHMMPYNRSYGDYDLPGVPWVSYFTLRDHAFHGAYWHNAFGRQRSHGCVNLRPEDAKWVFLWTTPVIQPYDQLEYAEKGGTWVEVI